VKYPAMKNESWFDMKKDILRMKIMRIIRREGVLNAHEICRFINEHPNNPTLCYADIEKEWGGVNWDCSIKSVGCNFPFEKVRLQIRACIRRGWLKKIRMIWDDYREYRRGKDMFSFFYINRSQLDRRFGADLKRWITKK